MNTQLPDYHRSVQAVYGIMEKYGITPVMVDDDNFDDIGRSNYAEWEPDDIYYVVSYGCILPVEHWEITIGQETWIVRSFWLSTDHDWCKWELSMVHKETNAWHSMDFRLLIPKYSPWDEPNS